MNREEAIQEVRSRISCLDYLEKSKGGLYCCPTCHSGHKKNGTGALQYYPETNTWICYSCKASGEEKYTGDVIDLYRKATGTDFLTAISQMGQQIGITIDDERPRTATNDRIRPNTTVEEAGPEYITAAPDFTEKYTEWRRDISDPEAQQYLKSRGISESTAAAFWIGYDKARKLLVIPCSAGYYSARDITGTAQNKYNNPKGANVAIFNRKALYDGTWRPLFVTEGAIDALSIIEVGGDAIGLNSAGNWRLLVNELKKKRTERTLIIALDNDDVGKKAAESLSQGLRDLNIPFIIGEICGRYKDPNEALTKDRAAFIQTVAAAENGTTKPDNVANYIRQNMETEIEAMKAQSGRKTGFDNLDAQTGSIYAGLYIVGGISSVGKTTFMSQIADQMAERGEHVIYFSMEQSRLEMASKSISRITAKRDWEKAVSSLQIRTGAKGTSIKEATSEYLATIGDRVSIIEGNFNCTVSTIKNYVRQYIKDNGVKPVVIIDYLQVIQPDKDPDTGRKMTDPRQITDHNLTELRRLCREGITIFAISSVNRNNYLTPIDYEAFKESGGIEFTADVVWGLQLAVLNDDLFLKDKDVVKKRSRIAEAKEAIPREIELVCLKNRYGKTRYTAQFMYYPQYDYFEPKSDAWPPTDEI